MPFLRCPNETKKSPRQPNIMKDIEIHKYTIIYFTRIQKLFLDVLATNR